MAAKKSRSTSRSDKAVTARGGANVGSRSGKAGKVPEAKVSGAKAPRARAAGQTVTRVDGKNVRTSAGTPIGRVKPGPLGVDGVRMDKVPVTGRLVSLGSVDRDGARVLEQVIAGAREVTVSSGSGKTATLTGALLGVLRNVAGALERGESVTLLGEDPGADLEGAVVSSQEAADLLNVSRPFVVKLAKTGQLAHHLVGNRHRFDLADVLVYAEQIRRERSEALAAIAPVGGYVAEDF